MKWSFLAVCKLNFIDPPSLEMACTFGPWLQLHDDEFDWTRSRGKTVSIVIANSGFWWHDEIHLLLTSLTGLPILLKLSSILLGALLIFENPRIIHFEDCELNYHVYKKPIQSLLCSRSTNIVNEIKYLWSSLDIGAITPALDVVLACTVLD